LSRESRRQRYKGTVAKAGEVPAYGWIVVGFLEYGHHAFPPLPQKNAARMGHPVHSIATVKPGKLPQCIQLAVGENALDGTENFGGGDDLAGVALGVVGYVDERATDAGGQLLAAYAAEGVEVGRGQHAHPLRSIAE